MRCTPAIVVTVPDVPSRWKRPQRLWLATRAANGASASSTRLRHGGEDFRRDVVAAKGLGERDDAEPQRFPGLDLGQRVATSRRLRFSQTISDEPPPMSNRTIDFGVAIGEFAAAGGREKGLGLAVDDLELQSEPLAHFVEEISAVFGGAARFRGDQPRARDAARHHLVAADAQRLEGARDRGLAQPAGLRKPFARAGRCAKMRRRRETRRPSARATRRRQLFVPKSSAA